MSKIKPVKHRAIRAWANFWPSLIVWLPLLSILMLTDATIPAARRSAAVESNRILDLFDRPETTLILLVIVTESLIIKALLMGRNYQRIPYYFDARNNPTRDLAPNGRIEWKTDQLALSLIAANVIFATLYTLTILLFLNADWAAAHPTGVRVITNIARTGLMLVLLWGSYQLLSVPNHTEDEHISRRSILITAALIAQVVAVYIATRWYPPVADYVASHRIAIR